MMQWAGAGGNWPREGERPDESVACQQEQYACGPACAQMLLADLGISVEQQTIAEVCSTPVWPALLARTMRELVVEAGYWEGGRPFIQGVSTNQMIDILCASGCWAAVLWDSRTRLGHMVIVDGLKNQSLRIRDPWPPGTSYSMSRADFLNYWNEEAIWRRVR
jgi:ABC-type bacteriocin/lantibiotic exporter with double-glycine peptidase domain